VALPEPDAVYALPMGGEIFVWVMIGLFALLVVMILLLGMFYPGTGADQLRWRPTRSPELEAQNEVDDLDQMLAATNAKRRARGEGELTEGALHERLGEDTALRDRLRRRALEDRQAAPAPAAGADPQAVVDEEIRQMQEARDALRRRREERS
jgi:hypothetical protein